MASRRLGLTAGVLLGMTGIAATVGLGWLVAAAAAIALLATAQALRAGTSPPVRVRGRRGSAVSGPRFVSATVTVNGDGGGGTDRTGQQLGDIDDLERVRGVA